MAAAAMKNTVHFYRQRLTIGLCLDMLFFSKNQILHLFKLLFASKRILSFLILIIVSSLFNNTTPKTRYSTISLLTKLINNNNRRLYRYSKFSSLLGNYKQLKVKKELCILREALYDDVDSCG